MKDYKIMKTEAGWQVYKKTPKWTLFGIKYIWKPYIVSGGTSSIWNHSELKYAIDNLKIEVILDTEIKL